MIVKSTEQKGGWIKWVGGVFLLLVVIRLIQMPPSEKGPSELSEVEKEARHQKETEAFLRLSPAEHLAEAKSILKNDSANDSALRYLNSIRKDDKEYKEAQVILTQFKVARTKYDKNQAKVRELNAKKEKAATDTLMEGQRLYLAQKMEEIYLDNGMDIRVTAEGRNRSILKISYVLMSRAFVH
jgi:hypothetical protein